MVTPRVVIGKFNDGVTFGLRCSLPGNNALTGDSSLPGTFSFDSEWTDMVKIHQIGLMAFSTSIPIISGGTTNGFSTTWPALGYIPFVEARLNVGNVVYDDYFTYVSGATTINQIGCFGTIDNPNFGPNTLRILGGQSGQQFLYCVYKIAVPSQ